MNVNDLLALLHDARQELHVLASHLKDPKMEWPSYGLKTTAQAHERMVERIDEFLASGTPEETSMREENLALRAALRVRANNEEWRIRYLEAERERARLDTLRAALVSQRDALTDRVWKLEDSISLRYSKIRDWVEDDVRPLSSEVADRFYPITEYGIVRFSEDAEK